MNNQNLINQALLLLDRAYAPYSHFHVSCLLVMANGEVISGVNVENGSYGATVCAERNAIGAMIAAGNNPKDVVGVIICSNGECLTQPCGICRQVLSEFFASTMPIVMCNKKGEQKTMTLGELLPNAFDPASLNV